MKERNKANSNMKDDHHKKSSDEEIHQESCDDLFMKEYQMNEVNMIESSYEAIKDNEHSYLRETTLYILNMKWNKRYYPKDVREYLNWNGNHDNERMKTWKHKVSHECTKQHIHYVTNKDKLISAEHVAHHTIMNGKDVNKRMDY